MSEFAPFGISRTNMPCGDDFEVAEYTLKSVPKPHPDLKKYTLVVRDGVLVYVNGSTGPIDEDFFLHEAQRIYFELREALEDRYGQKDFLTQDPILDDSAWSQIVTGSEQRITVWSGDEMPEGVMMVLLALEAQACGRSEVRLSYAFRSEDESDDRVSML